MDAQTTTTTAMKRAFLIINCLVLAIGNCGCPLITRLYFIHGGKRIWFSSWLQAAGWPIILIPLLVSYVRRRRKSARARLFLMRPRVFVAAAVIGTLTSVCDYLYAYGVARLPVSTSSLILASQLAFTAAFAFLLVEQKLTAYSVNAVVLLTAGAVVLGVHSSGDRPAGETNRAYLLGFVMTVCAAVLYGFVLPLVELTYKKSKQDLTFTLAMEMQLVISFLATVFCTVGMMINNDFQIPNTQQYDAPTPNQGSSNRDNWVTAEDDTDDDEEADAAEPILTPSVLSNTLEKNPASSKASKRSWSHREEEALIACYMMHCTDQSMSTNQTKPEVWRKVYESYQAARESRPRELPERNLNMMQLHWKRMCTDIMKWVGCFEESKRVNRSGEKDKNILEYAKTIYHHQEGKKFSYQYAWETLCEYPKWKTKVERWTNCYGKGNNIAGDSGKKSDSSGKRIRVDDDDVDDEEGVSNKSVRPDGVKKAKAKAVQQRKGKGVSSTSGDGSLSLDEKLQIYAELKGNEVSLKREKLELEKEKERRRKEEMKHSLLQTLLSKPPPLTPKEEKMKDKLWAELYGEFSD